MILNTVESKTEQYLKCRRTDTTTSDTNSLRYTVLKYGPSQTSFEALSLTLSLTLSLSLSTVSLNNVVF